MNFSTLPTSAAAGLFAPAKTSDASGALFGDSDAAASTGPSFGQMLQSALGQVSGLQDHAAQMATSFAQGKTGDIHSVMIASEQATMALQLTTQIRNKAVDAYQEVMRMSM
jgi:flagellar hook-basal body complex protein FliE